MKASAVNDKLHAERTELEEALSKGKYLWLLSFQKENKVGVGGCMSQVQYQKIQEWGQDRQTFFGKYYFRYEFWGLSQKITSLKTP